MNHIHHIVPRHMGGSNDKSNLITLTIEEHAMAHKALYEEHGKKADYIAYKSLLKQMDNAERQLGLSSIGGKNNMGKSKSEEHKAKIAESIKKWHEDQNFSADGRNRTLESRSKQSIAMQGNTSSKNHSSSEYKSKQSLAMKAAWARRKAKTLP